MMSLPNPGHLYFTGKVVLLNRRRMTSNGHSYVYDAEIDCVCATNGTQIIMGSFRVDLNADDIPYAHGAYHVFAKV
jgi:hypothetical protein